MSSKKIRKGPSSSATTFKLGTRRKGNDGNMWKVSKTQKGVKRWIKITKKKSPVKKSRKMSRKVRKTSRKPRQSAKIKQDNKMIWGRMGSVYSPKTKHYLRLGTTASFNVIRDELVRDKEWYKRVKFMAKRGGVFGDKLKTLL